jgi:CRP-like cAMP-binding protein
VRWHLLAGIPDEEVQRLLSVARRCTYDRGEVVFHHGDPGDSLHLVVKGRFAVRVATRLGETALLAVRGPGDNFGELALIDPGEPRSATIMALEPSETFAVFRTEFERLRREQPQIDVTLAAFLAGEVRLLNRRLLDALYLPAERRVFRRLRELVDLYARAGGGPVEIPLTQEELAELAGTSRSTVNRVLREEEARGTVELRRGRAVVLDTDAIARRGR